LGIIFFGSGAFGLLLTSEKNDFLQAVPDSNSAAVIIKSGILIN
jgi:hypothetical protein